MRAILFLSSILISPICLALPVTFCYEAADYPPYVMPENHADVSSKGGLLADIVTRTSIANGVEPSFVIKPWLRCQKMVEENEAQGLFAMIKTEQRAKQFAFPRNEKIHRLMTAHYPLFVIKGGKFDRTRSVTQGENIGGFDLEHYKRNMEFGIGAPLGYVVYQMLKEKGALSSLDLSVEDGLKLVSNGRLDGYVVEELIGKHLVAKLGLVEQVSSSQKYLLSSQWHVAFNQDFYHSNKNHIDRFWASLAEHRKMVLKRYHKSNP